MKRLLLIPACGVIVLAAGACDRPSSDAAIAQDSVAGPLPAESAEPIREGWSEGENIRYLRAHRVDLTGDGSDEAIIASADGASYDSLDVAITIRSAGGDTLWHEAWRSLMYFKYDPIEGKADTTVERIVRRHVEQLVAPDRITTTGGLPAELQRGGDAQAAMREAVRYHLAEIDYRLSFDLVPSAPTPPRAFDRISATSIPPERFTVVLNELRSNPSYMYYAGGEATYVIAWSERERAFVRIYSCC